MYRRSRAMVLTLESNTGRYVCPNNCGRTYKNKSGVVQHLTYECGIEPKFECHVCNKKFAQKSRKRSHMIAIHKMIWLS